MMPSQTPAEIFRQALEHVAGTAFSAAGFRLQDNPMHHARGLFRYTKPLAEGVQVYVEFQVLVYTGGPSRFCVNLLRNIGPDARSDSGYAGRVEVTLARLVWEGFGVGQLNGPDHWWVFGDYTQLAYAIAEAGKLAFAFGVPFLEGNLAPENPLSAL